MSALRCTPPDDTGGVASCARVLSAAATGRRLTSEQAISPAFWARQLADPVLFAPTVDAVTEAADGRFLLEVGPGRTLTGRVRQAWLRGSSLLDGETGAPDGEPAGKLLNRG